MDYSNLTKEQIIAVINSGKIELYDLSKELRDDKNLVLEVVKKNGFALEFVSNRLRGDKEVVLEAVKKDGESLWFASGRLQNDKALLEILEEKDPSDWYPEDIEWYTERMEVLVRLREKELMENSIIESNIQSKKIKF